MAGYDVFEKFPIIGKSKYLYLTVVLNLLIRLRFAVAEFRLNPLKMSSIVVRSPL